MTANEKRLSLLHLFLFSRFTALIGLLWYRRQLISTHSSTHNEPIGQRMGILGEAFASCWLRFKKSFKPLEHNWREGKGEIDLIALHGGTLVFVEVRLRGEGALVQPFESIDAEKKRILERTARAYIRQLARAPVTYRFDVFGIQARTGQPPEIHHYENIPLFAHHYRP